LARRIIIASYPKGGFDVFLLDKQYLHYLTQSGKNLSVILLSYWLGIKPKIVYYKRLERHHGKSRWTFRKKLNLVLDSFLGFSTLPIRFFAGVGILVSVLSFIYGFYIFVAALMGGVSVPGYASIICVLSFLLGIAIFMLGMIAEYLARIYDEVSHKPEYVIEDVF
jgi:hypothetical protein